MSPCHFLMRMKKIYLILIIGLISALARGQATVTLLEPFNGQFNYLKIMNKPIVNSPDSIMVNTNGWIGAYAMPVVYSNVTRPVNGTTFTISSRRSRVNYSITITCTATIGSAASANVVFQYSTDGGTTWITTPGKVENSNTVTLAVALQSVNKQTSSIVSEVPPNALCRLVSTTSGVNAVITYNTGQEIY